MGRAKMGGKIVYKGTIKIFGEMDVFGKVGRWCHGAMLPCFDFKASNCMLQICAAYFKSIIPSKKLLKRKYLLTKKVKILGN